MHSHFSTLKKIKVLFFTLTFFIFASLHSQEITIHYTIDTVNLFPNPERGWAHSINPDKLNPAPALKKDDLLRWNSGSDKMTLVRKYYFIKEFGDAESPISQSFLDDFQADLNLCRSAGFKIIPRFNYIWEPGETNLDPSTDVIIKHIEQIKPYLYDNQDVIVFLEAGFVGAYGEWNKSFRNYIDNYSLQLKNDGILIRNALLSALPPQRFLVVRYMYWHKMYFWPEPLKEDEAFSQRPQARIGYHHDYIMQSPGWDAPDCESCPDYKEMHEYYVQDTKWVPSTGEPCAGGGGSTYYIHNNPCPQLRAIHISTLINNACIDYDFWKSKPWYNELTRDLGYRLGVKTLVLNPFAEQGKFLDLKLEISNIGYAAPFNKRIFEIILRSQETGETFRTDVTEAGGHKTDPRYWLTGDHEIELAIPIPTTLKNGKYDLILNFPDPALSLYHRPEYSIRLANEEMWEPETGYNILFRELVIKKY